MHIRSILRSVSLPRPAGLESGVGLSGRYTLVAPSGWIKSRESELKPPFIITVSFSTPDTDISSLGRSAHVLIVEFQSSETTNDNEDRETAGMVERHGLGEERKRDRERD